MSERSLCDKQTPMPKGADEMAEKINAVIAKESSAKDFQIAELTDQRDKPRKIEFLEDEAAMWKDKYSRMESERDDWKQRCEAFAAEEPTRFEAWLVERVPGKLKPRA